MSNPSPTLIVAGYGPGISHAVAERFGKEGFSIALLARNENKLKEAAGVLEKQGIRAAGFATDLGNEASVRQTVAAVHAKFGNITVLHWNAAALMAGDLVTTPIDQLRTVLDVGVTGLVTAVQATLGHLKATKGSVLVTNGGFGQLDVNVDAYATKTSNMGLAIGNAAKHKTVRLLSKRLEEEGVYVGEVMVLGTVKGTPWDTGDATIQATGIAESFWKLHTKRQEVLTQFK